MKLEPKNDVRDFILNSGINKIRSLQFLNNRLLIVCLVFVSGLDHIIQCNIWTLPQLCRSPSLQIHVSSAWISGNSSCHRGAAQNRSSFGNYQGLMMFVIPVLLFCWSL